MESKPILEQKTEQKEPKRNFNADLFIISLMTGYAFLSPLVIILLAYFLPPNQAEIIEKVILFMDKITLALFALGGALINTKTNQFYKSKKNAL